MDLSGTESISAPPTRVWEALNDPVILQQALPGCQSVSRQSDTVLAATVTVGIGSIRASFSGTVQVEPLAPPHRFNLRGRGKGGAAGFASGEAQVTLVENDDGRGTTLQYEVRAQVGGRLAQLGSRLVQATARKLAADFFARFAACLVANCLVADCPASPEAADTADGSRQAVETAETEDPQAGLAPLLWVPGLLLALAVLLYFVA